MARQIIFRYNGDASTEDVEQDFDNSFVVPEKGSTYQRKGKSWSVVEIQTTTSLDAKGPIPIIRIFLSAV